MVGGSIKKELKRVIGNYIFISLTVKNGSVYPIKIKCVT